jgi:histidinol-phosphate aminotransferase
MIGRRKLLTRMTASLLAGPLADLSASSSLSPTLPENRVLHLDRNENAYGPSPQAIATIRNHAPSANRFPKASDSLRQALSKFLGVPAQEILPSAGTDEILHMCAAAFLGPKRKLVMATPSYDALATYARSLGAEVVPIPLRKDHGHDLDAMLASTDANTGVVYVCNPNNPTGTLTDRHGLEKFIRTLPESVLLLVDEAYYEYAGSTAAYASAIAHRAQRENLVVTRTFSKVYGLAGLRLGFAVGSQSALTRLASQKLMLGLNELALVAGVVALQDSSHVARCVRQNQDDRQEFINQVNARMLRVLDTHTNFACLNVMRPSHEIIRHYAKNNVALPAEVPNMPTYIRVSLGLPSEMAEFWRVWDMLGSHPMSM